MSGLLTLLGSLATLALLAWNLSRAQAFTGSALVLLGGLLWLELKAARLPFFGYFSTAPALALVATRMVGAGPASFLFSLAVLLRTLLRGRPEPIWRLREALSDLLPCLAAIAVMGALSQPLAGPLAALSWLTLALLVPPVLAACLSEGENRVWGLARSRLLVPLVSLGCLALVLVGIPSWPVLLVLPLLLLLSELAVRSSLSEELGELGMRNQDVSQRLASSQETLQSLRESHQRQTEELRILEQLSRSLSRSESLDSTLETLLDIVLRLLRCQSAAVFLTRAPEGELEPAACRGPFAERFGSLRLLQLREPLVDQAALTGRVARSNGADAGPRLFQGEDTALAMPLGEEGVLYAGRPGSDEFSEQELRLAEAVAAHAAVALQSARRQQSERSALEQHRTANAHLKLWVDRLSSLLDGARELTSTLAADQLAVCLERAIRATIPHDVGILVLADQSPDRAWPEGAAHRIRAEALRGLLEVLRANRVPLLLHDVNQSRLDSPIEGQLSLLAAPFEFGAIVLLSPQTGAFSREDQDCLSLLGYLGAAALARAGQHQELVETHRKLQESQAQLVQSSKMAAVGQLAAGVAHELNTPLGAAVLSIQSSLSQLHKPELLEKKLNRSVRSLSQAQDIISKLLIYCRPGQSDRQILEPIQVVKDALLLLSSQLEKDGVRLELALEPAPAVEGSPTELQQVLTNLVMNARDAVLGPGARQRTIRLVTAELPDAVEFRVEDDGPGFGATDVGRIFDPFFTTKPIGKGTGLGLSISRELVAQHGGTLEARPLEGGGACFFFRLPIFREKE